MLTYHAYTHYFAETRNASVVDEHVEEAEEIFGEDKGGDGEVKSFTDHLFNLY
jgi:hypothetical protein